MNRRSFLTALGAFATQQKFRTLTPRIENDVNCEQPPFTVTRFPYIQNVRSDRASVIWATLEPGFGAVSYSSDGVSYQVAPAKVRFFGMAETGLLQNFYQYQADMTGLSPNTTYLYDVSVDGQDIPSAGTTQFRTAGPGPFTFLVIGDSGWGDPRIEAQGLIAQRVAAEKPAMLIHAGDLVYNPSGTYDSYQRNYFNYYAQTMCSVPFFPCPGNHDYEVPNALPYLAIHSVPSEGVPSPDRGRYYSYDWGNVHFVSVDAHQSLDRAVNSNGPMLGWLENDLRSTKQFWRIVYFHYPPYATGQNVNEPLSALVRQYMVPILERYGVQLVFNGHEHSYQRNVPIRQGNVVAAGLGTNYFTSGGGGAILYVVPSKPLVAVAKSEYHYLRAEVQGTRITVHSIRQDGAELDNYTVAPTPVFTDDPKAVPVTLTPGPVAGAIIRIIGSGLAAEETFGCGPNAPTNMAGTVVTVNGTPIQLLYVSPTQIYGVLPFAVDGNVTIRVTTANGFVERSV
jgi:3',5'-cyclic AMP phosphodiesterase CpdA